MCQQAMVVVWKSVPVGARCWPFAAKRSTDVEGTNAFLGHVRALRQRILNLVGEVQKPGIRANSERLLFEIEVLKYVHAS